MIGISNESLESLGAFRAGGEERDRTPAEKWDDGWRPRLNPTQQEMCDSTARFILCEGERGGAKSFGGLVKLVEHCFLNNNALAIIIVGVKRQAEEGGVWHKLQQEVLPIWKTGNKEIKQGQWTGKRYDDGIGIEYTEPTTNTAKDVYLWIENRFSGWSRVLLLSMPVDSLVVDRVKGMEPSLILVDEAQTLESDTYFKSIIQQLGRRPNISTIQQAIYCANPDGPSHWLYRRFWIIPVDEKTGKWNPLYARFHFPISENIHNLPPDYWGNVTEAVRGDPTEEARMVRGEWVDRPSGLALFADDFKRELHVRGDVAKGRGILPNNNYPINFSYDLGQAHTSISLQQVIPTKDKVWKICFDEMDFVGQYIPYADLVPLIIKRMMYWDNFKLDDETKIGPFRFKHISDNSAFNQFRAKDGSYDAWDIEQLSRAHVKEKLLPDKYIIKMVECPKGSHSVEARVRLLKDAMRMEEYLVSALCLRTIEMLTKLEEDDKERLKPKRDRKQIHRFDSGSYGFFYYGPGRGRMQLQTAQVDTGPAFYVCGRGRP